MTLDYGGAVDGQGNPRWATEGFRAGEPTAVAWLYAKYRPRMEVHAQAITNNYALAEDLAADGWVKAIARAATFDGENFQAWLYAIVTNRTLDEVRHARLHPMICVGLGQSAVGVRSGVGRPSRRGAGFGADAVDGLAHYLETRGPYLADTAVPRPDDLFERATMTRELLAVVARLDAKYALVLRLQTGNDWSYDQLADHLLTTRAAIKSLLYRARLQAAKVIVENPRDFPCLYEWALNNATSGHGRARAGPG